MEERSQDYEMQEGKFTLQEKLLSAKRGRLPSIVLTSATNHIHLQKQLISIVKGNSSSEARAMEIE
jgi:hypothetical protein